MHNTDSEVGRFLNEALKLKYSVTFHAMENNGAGWKLEQSYRRDFFHKRFYVAGYADHNINNAKRNSTWTTENEAGVRLCVQFFAVAEYRYSSPSALVFRSRWGFGFEYVIQYE